MSKLDDKSLESLLIPFGITPEKIKNFKELFEIGDAKKPSEFDNNVKIVETFLKKVLRYIETANSFKEQVSIANEFAKKQPSTPLVTTTILTQTQDLCKEYQQFVAATAEAIGDKGKLKSFSIA